MNKSTIEGIGIFGTIVGIAGLAFGLVLGKKTNDVAKKLDISLKALDKNTVVKVQQNIVDKATSNAVERHVTSAVKAAVDNVSDQIRSDMDSMIRKDVDRVYSDLKDSVSERVNNEIDNLDYNSICESVERKVKDKAFEEFFRQTTVGKVLLSTPKETPTNGLESIANILEQFDNDWEKAQALKTIMASKKN